jgi:NAD-dependent deacetylase
VDQLAEAVALFVEWHREARSVVAFTGAGISTESGIPDFRSPGGVWAKNRTVYFDEFLASASARQEYWRQKAEAQRDFADATPNVTHLTLARWERANRLRGVITQNIDGLHQQAGSQQVLELHGTAREVACLTCAWRDVADEWVARFVERDQVPDCPHCGGKLKHATVSFGQSLPAAILETAVEWASESNLFLALGSTLVVHPAAGLPRVARDAGAKLVIVNRDPTPLDQIARMVVNAPLGEFFKAVEFTEQQDPI